MNSVTVDDVYGHDPETDEVVRLHGEEPDGLGSADALENMPGEAPEGIVAGQRGIGRKPGKSNVPLYAGVGLVALLLGAGFVFLGPHASRRTFHPAVPAPVHVGLMPPPLAPSASLANVPVSALPSAIVHQKYVPLPSSTELSELLSLHSGAPAPRQTSIPMPQPTRPGELVLHSKPQTLPAAGVHTAGIVAAPGQGAPGGSLTAYLAVPPGHILAKPPALALASPGSPSPAASAAVPGVSGAGPRLQAAKPPSPVSSAVQSPAVAPIAAAARTAPMPPAAAQAALSPAQQTNLLQMVTELGALERSNEIKQAVLSAEVQQLASLTTGKMADFDRRLSMLEAQTAVAGAVQANSSAPVLAAIATQPVVAAPAPAAAPRFTPHQSTQTVASGASPATISAPVQYQVQAASPGLAMLSVVGGNGPPLEVQAGDYISGYGKVLAVVQQGDSWVVQTQSGNIQ